MRCWWAAPASTCGRLSTTCDSPAAFPPSRPPSRTSSARAGPTVTDLHARLAALDPVAAGRMEPTNHRRVVRALEVTLGSGQPFSTFGPGLEAYPPSPVAMIGLTMASEEVDRRIAERFARWVDGGLLPRGAGVGRAPGRYLADRSPGAGLSGTPAPRRRGRTPGRVHRGSGPPHPDVCPPPGLMVPAGSSHCLDGSCGRPRPAAGPGPGGAPTSSPGDDPATGPGDDPAAGIGGARRCR